MKFHKGIVTLAFWTLLLAPLLCGVGVLAHSCLCDEATACHHELDCSTDPCQILIVGTRVEQTRWDDSAEDLSQMVFSAPVPLGDLEQPLLRPEPCAALIVELPVGVACGCTLPLLC